MAGGDGMSDLNDFLNYVAQNAAYNGSDDEGQRFYDWGVNPWLRRMKDAYEANAPSSAPEVRVDLAPAREIYATTPVAETCMCDGCGMPGDRCATVMERSNGTRLRCCDACEHLPHKWRRTEPDGRFCRECSTFLLPSKEANS